jgi:hypothetical protein
VYSDNRYLIVQLNDDIELLEKKAGLYISETFFYYPTSILIITSTDKENYDAMLGSSTKVGGSLEDSEVKGGNKKKDVDYEIEYLDLDNLEEIGESMNSDYRNIKERIKKISKKSTNIKNKELVTSVTREIMA